jgi:hypothetical protein
MKTQTKIYGVLTVGALPTYVPLNLNLPIFSEDSDDGVLKLASENQYTSIKGSGDIKLTVSRNNTVTLSNALYVPTFSQVFVCLATGPYPLSVAKVTEKGFNVTFCGNDAIISDRGEHYY